MQLLKLSNNNSSPTSSNNNNMASKINERIITPSTIPAFVLPPTLEACRDSLKSRYLSISTRKLFKQKKIFYNHILLRSCWVSFETWIRKTN